MQLHAAKFLPGLDRARFFAALEEAVTKCPLRRVAFAVVPCVKVCAVEQHDGIRRRRARLVPRRHCAGVDLSRLRAERVVYHPRRAGNLGRVGVAESHAFQRLDLGDAVAAHAVGAVRGGNPAGVRHHADNVGFAKAAPLVAGAVFVNEKCPVEAKPQSDLAGDIGLTNK